MLECQLNDAEHQAFGLQQQIEFLTQAEKLATLKLQEASQKAASTAKKQQSCHGTHKLRIIRTGMDTTILSIEEWRGYEPVRVLASTYEADASLTDLASWIRAQEEKLAIRIVEYVY
jgi:hypothetical protein